MSWSEDESDSTYETSGTSTTTETDSETDKLSKLDTNDDKNDDKNDDEFSSSSITEMIVPTNYNSCFKPPCICGSELKQTSVKDAYLDSKGTKCNLCKKPYFAKSNDRIPIYHCNKKTSKHTEPYDLWFVYA